MPVYVAKDYDGNTTSIVLAENEPLAQAYWQGGDNIPHSVIEFKEEQLVDHPTGVVPLLRTKVKNIGTSFDKNEVLVVRKD